MAIFSISEINNIISDMIHNLVNMDYHLIHEKCKSNADDQFVAVLEKVLESGGAVTAEIRATKLSHKYIISTLVYNNRLYVAYGTQEFHHAYDNIYADNYNEAIKLKKQHSQKCKFDVFKELNSFFKIKADDSTIFTKLAEDEKLSKEFVYDMQTHLNKNPKFNRLDDYIHVY